MRINFDSNGLKRGQAQQRLGIPFTVDNRSAHDLSHELDVAGCDVQFNLTAISQAIDALSLGFQTNCLKVRSRYERVDGSIIDQEEPLPTLVRLGFES